VRVVEVVGAKAQVADVDLGVVRRTQFELQS
jgi:hypothetical protein